MSKKMLIDTSYPEETRVAVVNADGVLDDFQNELLGREPLKGNIYLAKVTRVEPSLQAAFIDYGGNRQGFLAFSEIHTDYYRIPVGDRTDLNSNGDNDDEDSELEHVEVEDVGGEDIDDEVRQKRKHKRSSFTQHYKIQEVIRKNQLILIQVVKEERGNKGAALSSYISLAGRYCVLMPNSHSGGGISRRIKKLEERKRMKSILDSLEMVEGMSVILRTAGIQRTKAEIQQDFKYLVNLWNDIRQKTLESTAPALIHEEAHLIRRTIRDMYDKSIDEIIVSTREAWKNARSFMKMITPSHARRISLYSEKETMPLFQKYGIENQINDIYTPVIVLPSGGYIVLQQTEALVSIDVNSGKATRERHIDETAFQTNMEAAKEIARQLRLRDLAGLVVVDFIDMEDNKKNHLLEQHFKESLHQDRARIQMGRVTSFGLLELSRQRLNVSVFDSTTCPCNVCNGSGYVMSDHALIIKALRHLEEKTITLELAVILLKLPSSAATLLLNDWRKTLFNLEERYQVTIRVEALTSPESYFQLFIVARYEGKGEDRKIYFLASNHQEKIYDSLEKDHSQEYKKQENRRKNTPNNRNKENYNKENYALESSDGEKNSGEKTSSRRRSAKKQVDNNNDSSSEQKNQRKTNYRGNRKPQDNAVENNNQPVALKNGVAKAEDFETSDTTPRKRRTVRRRNPVLSQKDDYPIQSSTQNIVANPTEKPSEESSVRKTKPKRNWVRRII